MNYEFHPEAEAELDAAVAYYESCREGLGIDFIHEIHYTIHNIVDYPFAWPIIHLDVRRCLANRFPYAILYGVHADHVQILAIMSLHRAPDYWKHRGVSP